MFGYRKFCNKIYQAAKYVIKALGDGFIPHAKIMKSETESLAERWILHKLTNTAKGMFEALEQREFGKATGIIHHYWLHDFRDTCIVCISLGFVEGELKLVGTIEGHTPGGVC
jgi:valyl-tRNA synthetase